MAAGDSRPASSGIRRARDTAAWQRGLVRKAQPPARRHQLEAVAPIPAGTPQPIAANAASTGRPVLVARQRKRLHHGLHRQRGAGGEEQGFHVPLQSRASSRRLHWLVSLTTAFGDVPTGGP